MKTVYEPSQCDNCLAVDICRSPRYEPDNKSFVNSISKSNNCCQDFYRKLNEFIDSLCSTCIYVPDEVRQ